MFQIKLSHVIAAASIVAIATSFNTGFAQEKPIELNFASYAGPAAAGSRVSEWWASELSKRTNGKIKINFFYGEALLTARDMIRGVGDGRADIGFSAIAYHPSELPLSQITNIPFVTENGEATIKSMAYLAERNKDLQNEYEKRNVIPMFYQTLGKTPIGASEEFNNIDDLKGKKIRAIGYTAQALDLIGANPVGITYPELYEAMQRKVVDAYTTVAFTAITDIKLPEVAPITMDPGIGEYGMVVVTMNKQKWESLPSDIQEIILHLNQEQTEKLLDTMQQVGAEVCNDVYKSGGTVISWSPEEKARWKNLVSDKVGKVFREQAIKARATGVEQFYSEYIDTVKNFESKSTYEPPLDKCVARRG